MSWKWMILWKTNCAYTHALRLFRTRNVTWKAPTVNSLPSTVGFSKWLCIYIYIFLENAWLTITHIIITKPPLEKWDGFRFGFCDFQTELFQWITESLSLTYWNVLGLLQVFSVEEFLDRYCFGINLVIFLCLMVRDDYIFLTSHQLFSK